MGPDSVIEYDGSAAVTATTRWQPCTSGGVAATLPALSSSAFRQHTPSQFLPAQGLLHDALDGAATRGVVKVARVEWSQARGELCVSGLANVALCMSAPGHVSMFGHGLAATLHNKSVGDPLTLRLGPCAEPPLLLAATGAAAAAALQSAPCEVVDRLAAAAEGLASHTGARRHRAVQVRMEAHRSRHGAAARPAQQ